MKKTPTLTSEPSFTDIYSSLYTMREDLERMRKPYGSRDNPARTCKDLFFGHPSTKDGISAILEFY